jgi:hypothetical protein
VPHEGSLERSLDKLNSGFKCTVAVQVFKKFELYKLK